jgi:hypothetical protein
MQVAARMNRSSDPNDPLRKRMCTFDDPHTYSAKIAVGALQRGKCEELSARMAAHVDANCPRHQVTFFEVLLKPTAEGRFALRTLLSNTMTVALKHHDRDCCYHDRYFRTP